MNVNENEYATFGLPGDPSNQHRFCSACSSVGQQSRHAAPLTLLIQASTHSHRKRKWRCWTTYSFLPSGRVRSMMRALLLPDLVFGLDGRSLAATSETGSGIHIVMSKKWEAASDFQADNLPQGKKNVTPGNRA